MLYLQTACSIFCLSFKLGIIPYCSIRKKYHNMHMNSIIYIANIYASLLSYFPVKYLFDFQTS